MNTITAKIKTFSALLTLAAGLLVAQTSSATTSFSVTPGTVSNSYNGSITLLIGGLTSGETVVVQKFLDVNGNGVMDAGDWLVQQYTLTDGQAGMVIGGVTNFNVPGDTDTVAGQITSPQAFRNGDFMLNIVGTYLYKVSSPSGHFTAMTGPLVVTNSNFPQKLTGNVVSNGASTVLPGSVVSLFPPPRPGHNGPGGNPLASAVVNSAGGYTIATAPGTYTLLAFRSNCLADFSTAPVVTLGSSQTITTNVAVTPATSTITGTVVDAVNSSLPLPGVLVIAQANGLIGATFSDTNGNFTVGVLSSPSQWQISANGTSLIVHGYVGPNDKTSANAGQNFGALGVTKANALFYGRVLDNLGNPLPNVDVNASDNNSLYQSDGFSTANGNYVCVAEGGLSNDPSYISAGNDSSPSGYIYSQADVNTNGGANVVVGTATELDFTGLLAPYTISGSLKTASGSPLSSIGIYAFATINGTQFNENADTDTNGDYSLNVGDGQWNVGVNTGGGDDTLPDGYFASSATVQIDNNNTNVNLTALSGTNTISGTLTDNNGNPIAGIGVYAFINGLNYNLNVATDHNGNYSVTVVNGTWTVGINTGGGGNALPGDYIAPQQQTVAINNNNQVANFVALLATNTISGTLTDNNGNPIAGVGVGAYTTASQQNLNQYTVTDHEGHYSLNVVNGSWNVYVNSGGPGTDDLPANYLTPQSQFFAISNSSVTINFIAPIATETISGFVTDNNGHPIVGVGVGANATVNQQNYNQYIDTDSNGHYSLNVANGGWNIYVNCSGGNDSLGSLFSSGNFTCPNNQSATISGNNATNNFSVQFCGGVSIATFLPMGEVGVDYGQTLQASSCNPPFSWGTLTGTLPPGVGWFPASGQLDGVPTNAGIFHFNVAIMDNVGSTTNQALSLTINAAVQITTASLPSDRNGVFYSQPLQATNGVAPYTWSLAPGSANLPANMSLSPAGLLSGTPTNLGTFTFTALVTDNLGGTNAQSLSLTVVSAIPLQITTTTLPPATQNSFYTNALSATGGQAPYSWSSTTLPAGLTLTTNGGLFGTPVNSGTNTFTVQVRDAVGSTANQLLSLVIIPQVQELPGALQVTITPATAATTAKWAVDGGALQKSGATLTNLTGGLHIVSFTAVTGFNTPSNESVFIAGGNTTKIAVAYTVKQKPVLTISSPKTGLTVTSNYVTVTGTTKDDVAVAEVYYFEPIGNTWNVAVNPNGNWATWIADVSLNPGANNLSFYAVDIYGNTSIINTNTLSVFYQLSTPISVNVYGPGKVTPNDNNLELVIGKPYTMTAVADTGCKFTGWTGSTNLASATLAFTMKSNLSFTASFKDTTAPTLTVTAPASTKSSNSVVMVSGTAKDNVGVTSVHYTINSGTPNSTVVTTNGYASWTAVLVLSPGQNIVQFYAEDASGNIAKAGALTLTDLSSGFAPQSLAGTILSFAQASVMHYSVFVGMSTFAYVQGHNFLVGDCAFIQVDPNTVELAYQYAALGDNGEGSGVITLTFTSTTGGTYANTSGDTGTFTMSGASGAAPSSLDGATVNGQAALEGAFTSKLTNGTFTATDQAQGSTGVGTYTYVLYAPQMALLTSSYTGAEAGITNIGLLNFGNGTFDSVLIESATYSYDYGTFSATVPTLAPKGFAPESLAGWQATVTIIHTAETPLTGFGTETFGQIDTGGTNYFSGEGDYTYTRTGPNTGLLSFLPLLPPVNTNDSGPILLNFSSATLATFTEGTNQGTVSLKQPLVKVPVTLTGRSLTITPATSSQGSVQSLVFAYDTATDPTKGETNSYTFGQFGPQVALLQTSDQTQKSNYLTLWFTTATSGSYVSFKIETGQSTKVSTGTFKLP